MEDLTLYAVPAFIVLLLVELGLSAAQGTDAYQRPDTFASLAMGLGNRVIYGLVGGGILAVELWF